MKILINSLIEKIINVYERIKLYNQSNCSRLNPWTAMTDILTIHNEWSETQNTALPLTLGRAINIPLLSKTWQNDQKSFFFLFLFSNPLPTYTIWTNLLFSLAQASLAIANCTQKEFYNTYFAIERKPHCQKSMRFL